MADEINIKKAIIEGVIKRLLEEIRLKSTQ